MTYTAFPFVILREFDDSGRLLSGGYIKFFVSGTTTPKEVFATSTGSISLGSIVQLSASGTATIFLGDGAYDIVITDSNHVQIGRVDGYVGSGIDDFSTSYTKTFNTYGDLRSSSVEYSIVSVGGRTTVGDGGQGIFYRVPGSISSDDGGVILVTLAGVRYKRICSSIDPSYYGVKYQDMVDQGSLLTQVIYKAQSLKLPILINDLICILSTITIPSGVEVIFNVGGKLWSNQNTLVTFEEGSILKGIDNCFTGIKTSLPLTIKNLISYYAFDTDLVNLTVALESNINGTVVIDKDITITDSSLLIPNTNTLTFENDSIITLDATVGSTSTLSISCKNLFNPNYNRIFNISSNWIFFGIMDFGKRFIAPEEFGYTEYASTLIPLLSGNVILLKAREYNDSTTTIGQNFTVSNLNIKGVNRNSVININSNISGTNLNVSDGGIKPLSTFSYTNVVLKNVVHYDFEATYTNLIAENCSLPFEKLVVTNSNMSQVVDINADFHGVGRTWYVGKPTLIEPHLTEAYIDDIKPAQLLSTDSNGKVYGTNVTNYYNVVSDSNGLLTGTLKPFIRSRVVTVPHSEKGNFTVIRLLHNYWFTELPIQHNSLIKLGDTLSMIGHCTADSIRFSLGIFVRNGNVMKCLARTAFIDTVASGSYTVYKEPIATLYSTYTLDSSNRYYIGVYTYTDGAVDLTWVTVFQPNALPQTIMEGACRGFSNESPDPGSEVTLSNGFMQYIHHEWCPVG